MIRKALATLIVAVVLGTGMTVNAEAAPARSNDAQVQRLQQKVKNLREDVRFWRTEVSYLDAALSAAQNKPRYPDYTSTTSANQTLTLYRVTWPATDVNGNTYSWTSDPFYSKGQRDAFIQLLLADKSVGRPITTETATVAAPGWSADQ